MNAAGESLSSASFLMVRGGKLWQVYGGESRSRKGEDKKYLGGTGHRPLQRGGRIKIEGPLPIRLKKKRVDGKGGRPRSIA